MSMLSRRRLLNLGATATAGVFVAPYLIPSGVLAAEGNPGANDRVGIGAVGVGNRASLLLNQLPEGAQIVALSDCNLPRAGAFRDKKKASWPIYQHHERLVERKDIDGVIIATVDFQRVLPCIHACQAGKDIYTEKPLTLYISEGRALVNAVRRYGRICQVGSQQRSMEMNRIACELIRSGGLGKVKEVRAFNYTGPRMGKETPPEEAIPEGLDWDRWLNQAAMRPYGSNWILHYKHYDFSGGEMTNWGAHGVDQIQWALGMDETGPVEVRPLTSGPNGQVEMRYANGVRVRFILDRGPQGGAVFVCEKGKLEINRNKFTSNPKEIATELRKKVNVAEEERKWSDHLALWQARWHLQNWLDCMKTRQRPVADVEIGHRSVTVCHLANITRWAGRRLEWDPAKETFLGDEDANKYLTRVRRKGYELPIIA